ncbi:MAG: 3-deoxy-D-manno-octulosonate 8-phosphate phosphatase, partial [Bacteroidaceae bacterium]|nr:3-deoxy-D-manno-octulosonate 8-phosphate phosphatase [Bacteroidaceae bacterium]
MKKIKALVFDVDGVLSKGMVRVDAEGNLVRTTHTKDAYALRLASMLGLRVAIITGAYEERIRHRYEALGV